VGQDAGMTSSADHQLKNKIDDKQRPGLFDLAPAEITELTGDEFGVGLNKLQLGKAADHYLKKLQHGNGLLNNDTKWLLKINKVGRKKMGDNAGLSPVEIKAVAGLDGLVKAAVLAETHADYAHENEFVSSIHRLYAPMRIGQEIYRVKLTVKEYAGEDGKRNLHALSAVEIENAPPGTFPTYAEKSALQPGQPTAGRLLSIVELMDGATLADGQPFKQ